MIEINHFEEITQIRMSRASHGNPPYWVSAYYVDGLLIDTGCSDTAEELAEFLESQKLDLVVNTHHHEDHIGGNELIGRRFGVEILAHPDSLPMIDRPPLPPPYRERVWGSPPASDVSPIPRKIVTNRYRFDVIDTPGHCPGHIALVEKSRGWCFSGDLYVGEKIKVCGPEHDVGEMVTSMNRLLCVDTDRLVLFTAMRTIEPNGRRALRSGIKYFEEMSRHARDLYRDGFTVEGIVDELLGGESVFDRITKGQYSSANLVRLLLSADFEEVRSDSENAAS
ncbi:MAG: MBL fold metallo-hydrolase [Desulfomonilaceae bacterium]|nr:MBL fold metallo-hydrolase [Desulfomonilaceae bacterium]